MHLTTYECTFCTVSVSRADAFEGPPTCLRCRVQMQRVVAD
ncbi:hypothetical protein [Halogranum rubrum]|uniref:Rubrerythrin-like domain-containing protein n=1 Tax=Halogranum salarium B-1 TaxID=1210908 RepID=J2ZD25_9EURY|nr:hypothetical protein [Halogranum salarium]EJN58580.1 hypothetical protein HSB1_30580 [Halogranum salarium B-1]